MRKKPKKITFSPFEFGWVVSACKQQPICECEVFLNLRFILVVFCLVRLTLSYLFFHLLMLCYCTDSYLKYIFIVKQVYRLATELVRWWIWKPDKQSNGWMILISIFEIFHYRYKDWCKRLFFQFQRSQATTVTANLRRFGIFNRILDMKYGLIYLWVIGMECLKTKVFGFYFLLCFSKKFFFF